MQENIKLEIKMDSNDILDTIEYKVFEEIMNEERMGVDFGNLSIGALKDGAYCLIEMEDNNYGLDKYIVCLSKRTMPTEIFLSKSLSGAFSKIIQLHILNVEEAITKTHLYNSMISKEKNAEESVKKNIRKIK